MDSIDDMAAEKAELKALRARLRVRAERMVACVEALDDPETLSDAWRGVRLIRQADAMVCQLYAAPESVVRPWVARLAPSPARFAGNDNYDDDSAPAADDIDARKAALEAKLHRMSDSRRERDEMERELLRRFDNRATARENGAWPDGTSFVEGMPEPAFAEASAWQALEARSESTAWQAPENEPEPAVIYEEAASMASTPPPPACAEASAWQAPECHSEPRIVSVLGQIELERRGRPFRGLSDGYYNTRPQPPWPPPGANLPP